MLLMSTMRPLRHAKTNVQRVMILAKTHSIMEGTNRTDHQAWPYIIRVMKSGRLIMCNMTQICSKPIPIELHLWKQFKK